MLKTIFWQYQIEFPQEAQRQGQFESILETPSQDTLLSRTNMVGHVTASGILIWRSKSKVLLVKHPGLNDFYQPGGHFKSPSETPLAVATRHVEGVLGTSAFRHFPTHSDPSLPIDIDTHPIPAYEAMHEGVHVHFDFRYLFILEEPTNRSDADTDSLRWENINELSRRRTFEALVPKIEKALTQVHTRLFFEDVCLPLQQFQDVSCVVVAHFIPDVYPYLHALKQHFRVLGIIPKPNSIVADVETRLQATFKIYHWSRADIKSLNPLLELVRSTDNRFLMIDIGGYFSGIINDLAKKVGQRFVGLVEDTENGHQKYEKAATTAPLSVPVVSVARSPLKQNEDFLVGQSILFSTDFILREFGQLVQYLQCAILGYGKIGSSIAHHLLLRGAKPWVYDTNPIRRASALNQLCNAPPRQYIVKNADVIFCATGNRALDITDFRCLKPGCIVVSVTSADDELDLRYVHAEYKTDNVTRHLTKHSSFANYFYLANKGNAINFVHNAVLGDWIHLVRGEMLHAAAYLLKEAPAPGLGELPAKEREHVVETWLRIFVDERGDYSNH